MKIYQKGSAVVTLLIIIVLLVIAFGVYFYVQNISKPSNPSGQVFGWQEYTDTKLNISFKYPDGWKVTPTIKSDTNYNGDLLIPSDNTGNDGIYISQTNCQAIIQQHPGKIAECKEIGNVAVYYATTANQQLKNEFDTVFASVVTTSQTTTKQSLTITYPKGGETWTSGSTHTITWTTSNIPNSDKVNITLISYNKGYHATDMNHPSGYVLTGGVAGGGSNLSASGVPANSHSFVWKVSSGNGTDPFPFAPGPYFKIQISDSNGLVTTPSISSNYFSIVALVTACTPNWHCGWSACTNNYQSEIAVDSNNCKLPLPKVGIVCPTLARTCTTTPATAP